MRTSLRIFSVLALLGVGYTLGSLRLFEPENLQAQPAKKNTLEDRIKRAHTTLGNLQKEMSDTGKYSPVVTGVNSFAVTVGGVDALRDLEEGRGVDPETFAAIYAEQFQPKLAKDFKRNSDGQWTYKDKVVRIYSEKRLKELFANRLKIAGVKVKSR